MRQLAVVRIRTSRSVAQLRRRDAEAQLRSTRTRLALEFVTLLILGWSALCATLLTGHY